MFDWSEDAGLAAVGASMDETEYVGSNREPGGLISALVAYDAVECGCRTVAFMNGMSSTL